MKCVYVSGYYHVRKKQDHTPEKMEFGRYLKLIPGTIELLQGSTLVFFYEEDFILELFQRLCINHDVSLIAIHRKTTELPAYEDVVAMQDFISNAGRYEIHKLADRFPRDKGTHHFRKFFCRYKDPEIYRQNVSIWLSKIALVKTAMDSIESAQWFAWVDAGISRFNHRRTKWRFPVVTPTADQIMHYGSVQHYMGKRLPLNASYLCGHRRTWERLNDVFYAQLRKSINNAYVHDEETILGNVYQQHPELFCCLGNPITGNFLTRKLRKMANIVLDKDFR